MTIQTLYRPTQRGLPSLRDTAIRGAKLAGRAILATLQHWRKHVTIRRELDAWRRFDDHLLRDIGLHRGDVVWLDGVTTSTLSRAVQLDQRSRHLN